MTKGQRTISSLLAVIAALRDGRMTNRPLSLMVSLLIGLAVVELAGCSSPLKYHASPGHGQTGLHYAAANGHPKMLKRYLDAGSLALDDGTVVVFDPNKQDDVGNTPLHLAARGGHKKCVAVLLGHGTNPTLFDPNKQDDVGNTPLHLAARGGHNKCVAVLLAHGANPTLKNKEGKTPRDLAPGHPKTYQALLNAGG